MKKLSRIAAAVAIAIVPLSIASSASAAPSGASCHGKGSHCQPLQVSGNYRLAFDDEFDGNRLDTTKWNNGWSEGWHDGKTGISGPVNELETACYDQRNVSVRGGALRLNVAKRGTECAGATDPQTMRALPNTGAHVNTAHKFDFVRGVYEARVYIPAAADGKQCANFPAIWSDGYSWPADGEIDLFECLKETETGPAGGQWHIHTHRGDPHEDGGKVDDFVGWHTVSYEWTDSSLTFRYDGKVVGTTTNYKPAAKHYLILNNTTGRTWTGEDTLPAQLQVDYVRVWQKA